MASYDYIISTDENVFRAPGKMQQKVVRKPLGDVTNSSKPLARNKSTVKTFSKKGQATVRKPLKDLTNSTRPPVQEKSSKKICAQNVSAVKEQQDYNWVKHEGFTHNHDECIKQRNSQTMSMDYFLETIALKKDSALSVRAQQESVTSHYELEPPLELEELETPLIDIFSLPASPGLNEPGSPCSEIDYWNDLEFSPLKLKDSPVRI